MKNDIWGLGSDMERCEFRQADISNLLRVLSERLEEESVSQDENKAIVGAVLIKRMGMFLSLLSVATDLSIAQEQTISKATNQIYTYAKAEKAKVPETAATVPEDKA